jgi:hypothetical protein
LALSELHVFVPAVKVNAHLACETFLNKGTFKKVNSQHLAARSIHI